MRRSVTRSSCHGGATRVLRCRCEGICRIEEPGASRSPQLGRPLISAADSAEVVRDVRHLGSRAHVGDLRGSAAAPRRRRARCRCGRRIRRVAGTTCSRRMSRSPAARNWFTVSAPPATEMSPPPALRRACASADSIPSVTKWKVVPPSIAHRVARMVREHEHRAVVRRVIAPPPAPVAVPLAPHRAEHVAAHDVCLRGEDRIQFCSVLLAVIEHPRVQHGVIHSIAEGCLLALVVPRGVPVRRNREICVDDAHADSLLGCRAFLPDSRHDIRELRHAGHRDRQAG